VPMHKVARRKLQPARRHKQRTFSGSNKSHARYVLQEYLHGGGQYAYSANFGAETFVLCFVSDLRRRVSPDGRQVEALAGMATDPTRRTAFRMADLSFVLPRM
jgi:hypothetical protein